MSPPTIGTPIQVRIAADHIDAIDALAFELKMTRAETIRYALGQFLDDNHLLVARAQRRLKRRENAR